MKLVLLLFFNYHLFNFKHHHQDKPAYTGDDYGDSDNEAEPDAYLARVKREGQERDEDDDDSDESTDEDFNPEGQESDVAEE